MAELTPEQKAEMIAAAQGRSDAETQVVREWADAPETRVVPEAPVHTPSFAAQGEARAEWGPYDDYVLVTTNYGQFGIPKGEVMWFEEVTTFSRRAGQMVTVHEPRYRDAKTGLTRDPRTGVYYDPAKEKVRSWMPVHKVKGGYQWGQKGKVYPTKAQAERQGRAAYAAGYKGSSQKTSSSKQKKK